MSHKEKFLSHARESIVAQLNARIAEFDSEINKAGGSVSLHFPDNLDEGAVSYEVEFKGIPNELRERIEQRLGKVAGK